MKKFDDEAAERINLLVNNVDVRLKEIAEESPELKSYALTYSKLLEMRDEMITSITKLKSFLYPLDGCDKKLIRSLLTYNDLIDIIAKEFPIIRFPSGLTDDSLINICTNTIENIRQKVSCSQDQMIEIILEAAKFDEQIGEISLLLMQIADEYE